MSRQFKRGTRFWVFRAQIIRPAGVALDAVLKIDPTGECEAACKNELKVYQTKGKVLQGTALPIFYGCFQVRIGEAMVTCLAMEHCGEPLKKNFDELDADLIGNEDIKCLIWDGYEPGWQKANMELTAEYLYKELCEERMVTWGTDQVSERKTRLDIYDPAAP